METNEAYPEIITMTINVFVDRIEQVLLGKGTARAERSSICSEVETQVHLMIERKIESGSELNLELVTGIIESMDPPESYANSMESIAIESTVVESSVKVENTPPKSRFAAAKPWFDQVRQLLDRPARTTPGFDWVAASGLVSICIGICLLVLVLFLGRRGGEGVAVVGFLAMFVGTIASGISFWRIRHSNGLLTGQRVASAGMLTLPLLIVNAILCAILFASPLGRFLGSVAMLVALIYANYRLAKYSLHWLGAYSVSVPEAERVSPEVGSSSSSLPSTIVEASI